MWYDAIVIGLGPAGSAAARGLARAGASVLALDRAPLGRSKPCGGGLSARIDRILDPAFHEVVEATATEVRVAYRGLDEIRAVFDRPVAYLVRRERFDRLLAEQARAAGARIHEHEAVTHIETEPDGVRVTTALGGYRARFVIGADGAMGLTARLVQPGRRRRLAASLESEVDAGETITVFTEGATGADAIIIDIGALPGGYGWVFPKAGRLSVGIAAMAGRSGRLASRFARFVASRPGLTSPTCGSVPRPTGYPIPLFTGLPLSRGRLAIAGDAAGCVDPLLGEGIYYAVRSGQLAAEAVRRALAGHAPNGAEHLAEYDRQVAVEILPELEAARTLARLLYCAPRLWLGLARRHPGALRRYGRVLQGEDTLTGLAAAVKARALGWWVPRQPADLVEREAAWPVTEQGQDV